MRIILPHCGYADGADVNAARNSSCVHYLFYRVSGGLIIIFDTLFEMMVMHTCILAGKTYV